MSKNKTQEELTLEEVFITDELFNRNNETAFNIASDLEDCKIVSRMFFKGIMSLIDGLDKLCKELDSINKKDVVKLTIDTVMRKIAHGTCREHLHWSPTQSGKTAFKTVKICVYLSMNIPVVLLTKGKKESEELYSKITSYLEGCSLQHSIFSVYEDEDLIRDEFMSYEEASVLIIPDTYQQINRTYDILAKSLDEAQHNGFCCAGCALILDEADAVIHRSENQNQKNERALKRFVNKLNPFLVKVTATPIPTLSQSIDKKPIITTAKKTIKNYVGVVNQHHEDLDPESMRNGFGLKQFGKKASTFEVTTRNSNKSLALFPKKEGRKHKDKLQQRKKFENVMQKSIPYFNNQCIKHIRREINLKNASGMLTLVDTCPWVNTEKKNIFLQASGVQDYFYEINKKRMIVIVVHADRVFYRLPGHKYSFECKRTLGELIEKIDSSDKYGLEMPIVIFGYYAMKRSRSFRSDKRIPTSMILCMGDGQSNENIRQAGGRPTFKGLDVLKKNRGTDSIRMLCPETDFDIIQKYDALVLEIIHLYETRQLSWKEIVSELNRCSRNYFVPHSKRRTGNYVPNSGGSSKTKQKRRKIRESFPQKLFESFRSMRDEESSDKDKENESDNHTDCNCDCGTESTDATEKPLVPLSGGATGIPNGATPTDSSEECSETLADSIASLSLANSGDKSSPGSPGLGLVDTNTTVPATELLPDEVESNSNSNSSSGSGSNCEAEEEAEEAPTGDEARQKRCTRRQEEEVVDSMDSEDVDCDVDMTGGGTEEEAIDLTDD